MIKQKKKFDSADGFLFYCNELKKHPNSIFSRQQFNGMLWVWGAILSTMDKCLFVSLVAEKNSQKYQASLIKQLLPFGEYLDCSNGTFQQENPSIHAQKNDLDIRISM